MTTFKGAQFRPLATAQRQPRMAAHDVVVLHTMVGTLTGTDRMFHANGWSGTESHFGIGGRWGDGRDGEIIQWQDTEFTADANLDGNHRVISIETGDNFPRSAADIEPWTPRQLDSIVAVTAWACRRYDIPAVLIPDSKPGRRGIGYHRLGIDPWRVPGGEKWSSARGKECPADQRIAQMPEIVARVKAVLAGEEEDVVQPSDWKDHRLTEADAAAMGDPSREGESVSWDALLRFPPSVERVRDEQAAQAKAVLEGLAAQKTQFTTLTIALGEIAKTLKDIAARLPPAVP